MFTARHEMDIFSAGCELRAEIAPDSTGAYDCDFHWFLIYLFGVPAPPAQRDGSGFVNRLHLP
jgi:hypothetical protein